MNFSLVFENSGDSIPFQTIDNQAAEVLEYYVENLNAQNANNFLEYNNISKRLVEYTNKLDSTIAECNKFVYELIDQNIDAYPIEEYLDQINLNKLHADWVNTQTIEYNILEKRKKYQSAQAEQIHDMYPDEIPTPVVGDVIKKLNCGVAYDNINTSVHNLEGVFNKLKFQVADVAWFNILNPFPKNILTNDVCNFRIAFNHLGRTLYDKFNNFDHNLVFDDENTYDQLLGFVELTFLPPQTIPLSKEYLQWCNKHNKIPSGDNLNIGNIPDLTTGLARYRTIIFQNTLQGNKFSIQLNKGN